MINTRTLKQFEQQRKSAGVAFVLCWLVGIFGGHRFYMRKPLGIVMLIITLVSAPLCLILIGFLGLAATYVWMIVDLFSIFRWVREYNCAVLDRISADAGERNMSVAPGMTGKYYYASPQNQPVGPVTREELVQLAQSGTITANTKVIEEGAPAWSTWSNFQPSKTA